LEEEFVVFLHSATAETAGVPNGIRSRTERATTKTGVGDIKVTVACLRDP
jgi:hypothetical protein